MNCHNAHRLLSAERDGTLAPRERADLDAHLADCGDCRRARANVTAVIESWKVVNTTAAVPDVERAWHDIRREIRTTAPVKREGFFGIPRWATPVGAVAAAAVAVVVTVAPNWRGKTPAAAPVATIARLDTARADFVEVPNNSSSMVYVDDKSGWLVVWAVDDKDKM